MQEFKAEKNVSLPPKDEQESTKKMKPSFFQLPQEMKQASRRSKEEDGDNISINSDGGQTGEEVEKKGSSRGRSSAGRSSKSGRGKSDGEWSNKEPKKLPSVIGGRMPRKARAKPIQEDSGSQPEPPLPSFAIPSEAVVTTLSPDRTFKSWNTKSTRSTSTLSHGDIGGKPLSSFSSSLSANAPSFVVSGAPACDYSVSAYSASQSSFASEMQREADSVCVDSMFSNMSLSAASGPGMSSFSVGSKLDLSAVQAHAMRSMGREDQLSSDFLSYVSDPRSVDSYSKRSSNFLDRSEQDKSKTSSQAWISFDAEMKKGDRFHLSHFASPLKESKLRLSSESVTTATTRTTQTSTIASSKMAFSESSLQRTLATLEKSYGRSAGDDILEPVDTSPKPLPIEEPQYSILPPLSADFQVRQAKLPPMLTSTSASANLGNKHDWLIQMNQELEDTPKGDLDPDEIPISSVINGWARLKTAEGASMVDRWLKRLEEEEERGNHIASLTNKMYTVAVDTWAKSGGKGAAYQAENLLQRMDNLYRKTRNVHLKPTTETFNAVINAWARSGEDVAPFRAEQLLHWMHKLFENGNVDVKPDKYSFNTVIHAFAKAGGKDAALRAQELLKHMEEVSQTQNFNVKPDTITYNVVINAWAKSGGKDGAAEAEKLLKKMHQMYKSGDSDVKPNSVTYGTVIDSWAKSGLDKAAQRADDILAKMIEIHQTDPIENADLRPNTWIFNTVINAWSKSSQTDAATRAEEMLVAMKRLHACGIPGLKPDAFTYTGVIDAWARRRFRGSANRAHQLLQQMESEYEAGNADLKPHVFAYNSVINAVAKSGEDGAAERAEGILRSMLEKYWAGSHDIIPSTINFNTVLDAYAKTCQSSSAEKAEEILKWMDGLYRNEGITDVKPDTITFNAVIDAWARSGDRRAPSRAEQILNHMDEINQSGNKDVKPDTYTFNTVINAWAKSGDRNSASRAEHILSVMEDRYKLGDIKAKPNIRTYTSVIDCCAKSGDVGAARRANDILRRIRMLYQAGDADVQPNAHTYNAVINACAFSKHEEDFPEAIRIAFSVFEEFSALKQMKPDAYTYASLLSVCANLLPQDDQSRRFACSKLLFESCVQTGHVNEFVLKKLKQAVTAKEYIFFVGSSGVDVDQLPSSWTRNAQNTRRSYNRDKNNNNSSRRNKKTY